jgi:hypothetical protein
LLLAAEGKQRFEWGLQSSLMALLANLKHGTKRNPQPYKPNHFNPFERLKRRKGSAVVGTMATSLLAPDKASKVGDLVAARDKAKETGDWTEFKRLAAEIHSGAH